MDIEQYEKAGLMAQTITFAFEDSYDDKTKQALFYALFDKYLLSVSGGQMVPYDAIVELWRKKPSEFDEMIKELRDKKLIETF